MNMIVYFVPVVAIVGMLFYTRWAQANVRNTKMRAGIGASVADSATSTSAE